MIKIKKIKNINTFYQNLDTFAEQVDSNVKIFKENTFYDDTPQFYFRKISKTTTAIYFETGERPRADQLKQNKTFLICKYFKIFKKDFIFAFILVSPFHFSVLPLCLIYTLLLAQPIIECLITFVVMMLVFYILEFSTILKLLNFFDDIANENREKTGHGSISSHNN